VAIYEYVCKKCSHVFEIMTTKPTDKKEKCPKCHKVAERLISQSTFTLKDGGVGWAEKGYSGNKGG